VLAFRVANCCLQRISKPLPRLRTNWALIRVRLAGICNTDIEILSGYHAFRGVPGHEFVGEVVELNSRSITMRKKWLGRRVCGEINVTCSAYGYKPLCDFCRRGLKTHCARRTVLGIITHDGAFAEHLALPLENLHLVPTTVSDEQAVFVEPLAAACEILDQLDIRQVPQGAVLGDGKLAQLIARVLHSSIAHASTSPRRGGLWPARSSPRSAVTIYGKHANKLALARRAGIATKKVRGDRSDLARIKDRYRLVVEATGSPTGLALAQQLTEPRGTLVLKSTFHGAAPVETWSVVVNELTVLGSRCGPFAKAIALLSSGQVDPTPLITRTYPLAAAPEAIRFAQRPAVLKVLLRAN
jgi:alcohol dehydrogenase